MGTVITAAQFRQQTTATAMSLLREWVGEERASEATGRIATAIAAAAACSKKPEEFYACTPASVGSVIAISALTGIMCSTGATALAYAIPRRPRKGEPPNLTYQLSHRGINALANRAGLTMIPIPIGFTDKISVDENGEVTVESRDIDNPPMTDEELRGVIVVVKSNATGKAIARGWVAKKLIHQRRQTSDSYQFAEKSGNEWAKDSSPWHVWPVEQAMKTAMHYAIGRGWAVIDDTEAVRALNADAAADLRQSDAVEGKVVSSQRGIEGLRQSLGVTEQVKQGEPETETKNDLGTEADAQVEAIKQGLKDKINKTASVQGLQAIRREVMDTTLAIQTKNELLDEIDERIAIVEES